MKEHPNQFVRWIDRRIDAGFTQAQSDVGLIGVGGMIVIMVLSGGKPSVWPLGAWGCLVIGIYGWRLIAWAERAEERKRRAKRRRQQRAAAKSNAEP